ncbi:MAG: hypothetical protein AMJ78_01460 [Omnitrophica WOR_2 bacterium SM23_29]|nr:MAG: hypothetical protein AMJ78_01460 [Omnitrophica WOR_2 bacterium SM23_29]
MKDFWEVLKTRRSIRKFKPTQVPEEDIRKITQMATLAPSAGNRQNWHFIVVKSSRLISQMNRCVQELVDELASRMESPSARQEFLSYSHYFTVFGQAPVVFAVVMKPYDSTTVRLLNRYFKKGEYKTTAGIQGVCAAIENLLLAAHALGYGGCWMTGPLIAKDKLEGLLEINPPDELIALIPIGMPDEVPKMPPRKDITEVITFK